MAVGQDGSFKGRHFTTEVILWALRWYLAFPISYRDLASMLADRGVVVDHSTLFRWVQAYAATLEQRIRKHLRPCTGSWRVDETYIKVKGMWTYLYRAVDSLGQTIDFLLSAKRDAAAARRFFHKVLRQLLASHGSQGHLRLESRIVVPACSLAQHRSCSAAIRAAIKQKLRSAHLFRNPEPAPSGVAGLPRRQWLACGELPALIRQIRENKGCGHP